MFMKINRLPYFKLNLAVKRHLEVQGCMLMFIYEASRSFTFRNILFVTFEMITFCNMEDNCAIYAARCHCYCTQTVRY